MNSLYSYQVNTGKYRTMYFDLQQPRTATTTTTTTTKSTTLPSPPSCLPSCPLYKYVSTFSRFCSYMTLHYITYIAYLLVNVHLYIPSAHIRSSTSANQTPPCLLTHASHASHAFHASHACLAYLWYTHTHQQSLPSTASTYLLGGSFCLHQSISLLLCLLPPLLSTIPNN